MVDPLYNQRESQFSSNYRIPRRDCEENDASSKNFQRRILENAYDSNERTRQSYTTRENGPPTYFQHQNSSYFVSNYDTSSGELYQANRFNPLKCAREVPKTSSASTKYGDTFPQNDPKLPKELTVQFQPLYCKLCTAKLSSNVMAKLHYKSKKHDKKVKTFLIEHAKKTGEPLPEEVISKRQKCDEDSNPKYFHCYVCDLPLTGRLHAESHYMGKNHHRALAGKAPAGKGHYNEEGKWMRNPTVTAVLPSDRDNIGLAFAGDVAIVETKNNSLCCEICCINVTSDQQMTVHLNGQKHKKKVQQLANDRIDGSPQGNPENNILSTLSSNVPSDDLSVYRTPSGFYYCNPCNLTLNSEIQFNQHLGSKKHRKKASTSKE